MGLPMWKDPEDEITADDIAAKVDRAAAARRSTIRRESSIRPRDAVTTSQSISRYLRDRHRNSGRLSDRNEAHLSRLSEQLDALRRERMYRAHESIRNQPESALLDHYRPSPDDNEGGVPSDMAVEPVDTIRQHLPRPPRESNLRFEVLPSSVSRSSSPWRYQVLARTSIPSPPYSAEGERRERDRSIPDGPIIDGPLPDDLDLNSMPALTEGFAPAHGASRATDRVGTSSEDREAQVETPPPESWQASYPPLRRVSRMSPRPLPRLDGLGDRRRSPSPASDAPEEETWANLLTAMDTERSSTATSFASYHSESHHRSGRSSQNTSTSFGEIGSGDDTCELDLPPGITQEDVLEMRAMHRPRDISRMTGRRGLREHHDRIADRVEINMFRAILERMQRREDVPDEWWATVGINPEIGRP